MSIAEALDVADASRGLLADVRHRWRAWQADCPPLAACEFDAFPGWLRSSAPDTVDEALWFLARQGATDGGDEVAAAAALAWALLPGAITLARALRSVPRIDDLVASAVWVQVRTFPWRRRRRVAANVLADARRAVLVEAGSVRHLRRVDRTAGATVPVAPWDLDLLVAPPGDGAVSPVDRVCAALEHAVQGGAVCRDGVELVWRLVEAAGRVEPTGRGRHGSGLLSAAVTDRVGADLGVSGRTVRRRGQLVLNQLSGFYRGRVSA